MAPSVLKLLAEDPEGLGIIASAAQDALARPQDIQFSSRSRTFGLELNRFQWERAGRRPPYFRTRAILAFSSVQNVRSRALSRSVDAIYSLINIGFEPAGEPPSGVVILTFAGAAQIELAVECLDVTMADIGSPWPTRHKPDHEKTRS